MAQEYGFDSDCTVISRNLNKVDNVVSDATPDLWYRVGEIDGHRIEWGSDIKYGKGLLPKVSINSNGDVVEVHQSKDNEALVFRVGKIDIRNKQIIWGNEKVFEHGVTPSVGLTNHGMTIVVFKSSSCNKLYYLIGQLSDLDIKWGSCHKYQDGLKPEITVCNDRKVVLTHESCENPGIWRLTGYVNEKNIILVSSTDFDSKSNFRMEMTTEVHASVFVYESHPYLLHHTKVYNFRYLVEQVM